MSKKSVVALLLYQSNVHATVLPLARQPHKKPCKRAEAVRCFLVDKPEKHVIELLFYTSEDLDNRIYYAKYT